MWLHCCSHLCWIVSRVRSFSSISLVLSCSVSSRRLLSKSAQPGISPTDLQTHSPQYHFSEGLASVIVMLLSGNGPPLRTCSDGWSSHTLCEDRWLLELMPSLCGSAPLHDGGECRCQNTPAGSPFWKDENGMTQCEAQIYHIASFNLPKRNTISSLAGCKLPHISGVKMSFERFVCG